MIVVQVLDANNFYVGTDIVNEQLANHIITEPPQGFYKPKWDGEKWVEGKTQQEIESDALLASLQPSPQELADADLEIKILTLLFEMEVI